MTERDSTTSQDRRQAELLRKYGRPGPRYTSYPTVPNWGETWDARSFDGLLGRYGAQLQEGAAKALSLYLHIPFCEQRCYFCGCNVVIDKHRALSEPYSEKLRREIDLVADRIGARAPVLQLHLGGGTPTHASVETLDAVLNHIERRFELLNGWEGSVEVDPAVTTVEHLELLRSHGFTRISIGVQDTDPAVQRAVGRVYGVGDLQRFIEECRRLEFESINLDLILGLPQQSVASWRQTVDRIVGWRPDRVAVFQYAHVPWMKAHQKRIHEAELPDRDTRKEMREICTRSFADGGYVPIGMDHFALPDDGLAVAQADGTLRRNFMGYVSLPSTHVLGLGLSSISEFDEAYSQNHSSLAKYERSLEASRIPVACGHALSHEDRLRREIIMKLMIHFECDLFEIAERYDVEGSKHFRRELRALRPMLDDELVEFQSGTLRATPLGRGFIRNVAMLFDESLHRPDDLAAQKYSQTL